MNFFKRVFTECTEANATSLIPLDTIIPEIYAFIIGYSCTVWTKMRSLTGSLADGVLAYTIRMVRGLQKSTETSNRKPFTSK